ncbi:MAG: 4Fe-4S binding protein [Phycisphaerae bacterium]|nr:4Fe-4S binding protein [Phycisphaerae bacterium]
MKIAVTSGKGGVGKTFVATNLAAVLSRDHDLDFIDCDVEAPNAHLFLSPNDRREEAVVLPCPTGADASRCTGCGACAEACYYNALAVMKGTMLVFPDLCRWCGACVLRCPNHAIQVSERNIGTLLSGRAGRIDVHWALLQTGAGGMSPRLIRMLKQRSTRDPAILDSPPGTTCPVVETITDADVVVLVGDATPFGLHDLRLSVEMCRRMGIQPVVVVNRVGIGDSTALRTWLARENLPCLAEFPDSREAAQRYSRGELVVDAMTEFRRRFEELAEKLRSLPIRETHSATAWDRVPNDSPEDMESAELPPAADGSRAGAEIVVVSGKGGVGKTSLAACFTQLAGGVVADCDVDAADLHLLLSPTVEIRGAFFGGRTMQIDPSRCTACGACAEACRFDAVAAGEGKTPRIRSSACEGCGACLLVCPAEAIQAAPTRDGRWFVSGTRLGNMSHAELEPGRENSGKLVTLVRKHAGILSARDGQDAETLLDGSPGTGCPVIASVGGARAAILVTEPTVSGLHDLRRILELTKHFRVPAGVIINKADLNDGLARDIRATAERENTPILGELPYNGVFNDAQQAGLTVLEFAPESELSNRIRQVWSAVREKLLRKNLQGETP